MEITLQKTVKVKHQITLPAYYKSLACHFKIYSEENCICVTKSEIGIKHAGLPFALENITECTETEFLTAFNATKLVIEQLTLNK
jgi:hypothetical protein